MQVQPEAYNQELEAYQQQQQQAASLLAAQHQREPQQFYTAGYQTEALYENQKNDPAILYQPQLAQGLAYQNEIPIGNQVQSYQQKVASQKFAHGIIGKGELLFISFHFIFQLLHSYKNTKNHCDQKLSFQFNVWYS